MSLPPLSWILPAPDGTLPFMILATPLIMDLLGLVVMGEAPGAYATLDPLAMAA